MKFKKTIILINIFLFSILTLLLADVNQDVERWLNGEIRYTHWAGPLALNGQCTELENAILDNSLAENAYDEWAFCNESENKAYWYAERSSFDHSTHISSYKNFRCPKADADWLCDEVPTWRDGDGDPNQNSVRCWAKQERVCELGGGGKGTTGRRTPHNVPHPAWYYMDGINAEYPEIRCQCGCFPEDVSLLTNEGEMQIGDFSQNPGDIRVALAAALIQEDFLFSDQLYKKDFTVGPEEKDLISIETEKGYSLKMTEKHPVVIVTNGTKEMVQAQALTIGDVLLTTNSEEVAITNISTVPMSGDNNIVYNIDTKGRNGNERVVIANGIRTGDVIWQNALSAREIRELTLLEYANRK